MAGMSRKEIARLLDHIEPQGVTATRTTKGLMLRLPDQTTAMLHFTGSDVREAKNVRSRLKRAGVTWPTDGEPLGPRITDHRPTRQTLAKVQAALEGWEQKSINASQLIRLMGGEPNFQAQKASGAKPGMTVLTAQRALYHLGWVPTGKSTARKWLRPLELEPEPIELEPEPIELEPEPIELEPEPQQPAAEPEPPAPVVLHPDREENRADSRQAALGAAAEQLVHTAPPQLQLVEEAKANHPAGREFIDTADSWTASPAALPEELTMRQVWQVLAAFGLEGELRIWRADD